MKTYEELLSDIEEDMELMGSTHIVYAKEENDTIADYDYLPSDSYTLSTTLKDLQENLRQRALFEKAARCASASDVNDQKLAVIFPGIGYTVDKPLLYYTGKLARHYGYQIKTVSYGPLPENVKGDSVKMKQAFDLASQQTEQILQEINWKSYGNILFVSKSIGTVIASAYASRHHLSVKSILFTPLTDTFKFPLPGSIAFHGTADPWAENDSVHALAQQNEIPLFLTKDANHSLETGDVFKDLSILKTTLERVNRFISDCSTCTL